VRASEKISDGDSFKMLEAVLMGIPIVIGELTDQVKAKSGVSL